MLLDSLPHRCTIRKRTRDYDSMSGFRNIDTVEQTGVECWRQSASSSEVQMFSKRDIKIACKIYFASNPNVTEQHEIIITHMVDQNGDLQEVTEEPYDVKDYAVPDAGAGLGVLYRVMVDTTTGRKS